MKKMENMTPLEVDAFLKTLVYILSQRLRNEEKMKGILQAMETYQIELPVIS